VSTGSSASWYFRPVDQDANAFVVEFEPFVRNIAFRVKNEFDLKSIELADLMAFGFQGLLEAKGRFDPTRGIQFNTFAYYRVRGAVIDGVRKMAYLPRHIHALRKSAEAADWALEEAGEERAAAIAAGETPTTEKTVAQIDDLMGKLTASFIIAAVGQDEGAQSPTPDELVIAREGSERVKQALADLPERERIVVTGMYFEERSLDDIGAQLGISRSWACRIHTKGLRLMRAAMEATE